VGDQVDHPLRGGVGLSAENRKKSGCSPNIGGLPGVDPVRV
jgi:hypothetical protein